MEEMSIAGIRGYVRYIVFDNSHNLIAISFVTSSRQIARAIGSNIKRDMPVMFAKNDSVLTRGGDYDVRYSKINMGYSYCYEGVAFSKLIGNGILFSSKEELYEKFYDAIMYNYDLPLLKQWMPDIYKHLKKDGSISAIRQVFVGTDVDEQICGIGTASDIVIIDYRALTEEKLEAVVSELLKNKSISFTDKPQKKLNVETLDDYISEYGSDIVSNLHQKAKPNIEVDGTWKYSVSKSRRLFAAQADCVNGIVNTLEHGRYCFVNEGMGCGKTLQSMMAIDGYMNKKYMKSHPGTTLEDIYRHPGCVCYRCIIMAPANLVEKWKEEISSQIVGANVVILNHMSQLVELKKSGRKPTGRNFYVIGKDFGKLSYVKKPIPRKMKTRELFMSVCAECGTEKQGSGKQPCICCGSKRYKEFSLKVMRRLRTAVDTWKEETGLGFGLYGTPAESLCYRFARIDKERFGTITDITDKGYYTNSYHVDVREKIDAFSKFQFESQFQPISSGGAISYVEIPNMQGNLEALASVVEYIYDNIQYAEFNTKSDYCHVCGYDGEILINDSNEWECPQCHNKDHSKMSVTRRTCGYLGEHFFNVGKTKEIKARKLHL